MPGSGVVLGRAPGLSERLRDAVAWKESRLISPLMKYPLANQSASIATLGRFTYQHATTTGNVLKKMFFFLFVRRGVFGVRFARKSSQIFLSTSCVPGV